MTTTTAYDFLADLSDELIEDMRQMRFSAFQPAARDADGAQRSLTDDEIAFGEALRAEVKRRGLH